MKKTICSICGNEIKLNHYKPQYGAVNLKDGVICTDCAEKLVVAYPVTYIDNPEYHSDFQIHYNRRTGERDDIHSDNGEPAYLIHYQGLEELMVAEYPQKLNAIEGVRMQLRRRYEAEAVFQVQGGFPLLEVDPFQIGIFEAKKFKNAYLYYGRCIVGEYTKKDAVTLIHEGKEYRTRILGAVTTCRPIDLVGMEKRYNAKKSKMIDHGWWEGLKKSNAAEGHSGYIILEKVTPGPMMGDMILKL